MQSPLWRHTPARVPSEPTNHTSLPCAKTLRRAHVVVMFAMGRTVSPSTASAVPPSPTTYVMAPTRADPRSSFFTPLSSARQLPSKRRTTPSSPAAIASVGDVAAMVRSATVDPVSYGLHPKTPSTFSSRYVTPPAPTVQAEPPAKPTTP